MARIAQEDVRAAYGIKRGLIVRTVENAHGGSPCDGWPLFESKYTQEELIDDMPENYVIERGAAALLIKFYAAQRARQSGSGRLFVCC